ncbi:MAG: RNA methyltransferase [Planctomycetaceae bacterium]
MSIELRNPHSVLAALETRPQDVVDIRVQAHHAAGAWERVVELAKRHHVLVRHGVIRDENARRQPRGDAAKAGRVGAAEATVKEHPGVDLTELFAGAKDHSSGNGLWLALDQLQDPHNVGAIFRAAAFFGVKGIVVTRDRSAPFSSTVYDVASGGIEFVPFSSQVNLSRALASAKESGLWILGASEHAEQDVSQIPRDRPWLLVLGNEEKGMRRLTEENCDLLCRLSPRGRVGSLNVSVAAGVLMATLTAAHSR